MNLQRAAELQVLLEGVPLPASRKELIRYAAAQDRAAAAELERLPDKEFTRLDDVGEALAPTQPRRRAPQVGLPKPESDLQPGGDDYVRPSPTSGAVRHDAPPDNPPQKAIEQQTKTQKKQQERQEHQEHGPGASAQTS